MIIKNLNVINKSVRIEKISINISKFGIYKISGPIGCGKTSLVEEVVFGDNDILFENEVYGEIYRKNRYKLFAYVPQNITQLDMSVKNFILRGNTCINDEKLISILNEIKHNKVIVLISHDERLNVEITGNFVIENNSMMDITNNDSMGLY